MKPIVRYNEIIVFDQFQSGSSNIIHNTGGQVLSDGTQQLMENAFFGMYHYRINIELGFNW